MADERGELRPVRVIGLHIARTAGTSVSKYFEDRLGPEKCLAISSYTGANQAGRMLPMEHIASLELPLFTYGHYVHESWIEYLRRRGPVVTFSFFREPDARRASLARHFDGLTADGTAQLPAPDFREGDIWCQEVLRCFPSAAQVLPHAQPWERARLALATLDMVRPHDEVDAVTDELFRHLHPEAAPGVPPKLNASGASAAAADEVGEPDDDNDRLLYDALMAGHRPAKEEVDALRAVMAKTYADDATAIETFQQHLRQYFLYELEALGNHAYMLKLLKQRRLHLDRAIKELEGASLV